jgi:photosystem II stability/assembly factor-like uncharacterized protein
MSLGRSALVSSFAIVLSGLAAAVLAQPYDPALLAEMRYRMIGPHRGGRTVAAVGVPGQPGVFLIGVNNGGVWKTTDYGRTWKPLFDDQPTGSVGAVAVAPSNPDVIYVGSGEGLQRPDLSTGDGVYKSTDGGRTWRNLGLRDGQQIPQILVDPRDPERVFVAVLGHPYGPNPERGVYRSTDGGARWQKVLGKDENTGAMDLAFDPSDPRTVYAVLWAARQAPWEIGGSWQVKGSGLFKSTDGGDNWSRLEKGLPAESERLGRIGIGIAPSRPQRIFALVDEPKVGGLYRSEDSGASWERINGDPRLWGRGGDFAEVKVDPKNPDVVYCVNVVAWKSTDGGKTFTGFRGAPGGDDPHRIWINPDDPKVMILAGDQGAIVSVNGGESWSSWYNQPTAQFYHVSTDNAFPYRVCGGQQESGSACVASRGDDGQITFREWHPVGAEEYGYVAADPLDPDVVYGGKLTRYDRRTGQVQEIAPKVFRRDGYRVVRTQPVLFSPINPKVLYFASNVVWKTMNGGQSWVAISPDLTRESYDLPPNLGVFAGQDPEKGKHRGVVYTIAPSPRDEDVLWAGTDDGLIHLTRDGGKTWASVTPPETRPWAKVSLLEASYFDPGAAYAAINTFRLDDLRPHVYRTRDFGKTWSHVTSGIPDEGVVNVVRADPKRRGLLFAGSERSVHVSFDDGDHWQPLRLNMPATSIRDLVVKDDDLVVGTHGRSFWVLDDISRLRQLSPDVTRADVFLFAPQEAIRVRWNQNTDTPLPQEEPAGQNPPEGAVIDYSLGARATRPVTLEILDGKGEVVRRYSSDDPVEPPVPGRNIPDYWIRPPQVLSAEAGVHRFYWDMRYAPPLVLEPGYPIAAVYGNTPREPRGPWALPGTYRVRLTVAGKSTAQPLALKMDPRVKTPPEALEQQLILSKALTTALGQGYEALQEVRRLRAALKERKLGGSGARTAAALDTALAALEEGASSGRGLVTLNDDLLRLYEIVQGADAAPTAPTVAAIEERQQVLAALLKRWQEVQRRELAAYDKEVKGARPKP